MKTFAHLGMDHTRPDCRLLLDVKNGVPGGVERYCEILKKHPMSPCHCPECFTEKIKILGVTHDRNCPYVRNIAMAARSVSEQAGFGKACLEGIICPHCNSDKNK